MKMTEIYDVTDADTEAVQSPTERETNKQLEFEHDWAAEFIADSGEFLHNSMYLPFSFYHHLHFCKFCDDASK